MSEERGETLAGLEMRALCGESTSCDPFSCARHGNRKRCREPVDADVCNGLPSQYLDRCKTFQDVVTAIVGTNGFVLAAPVLDQLDVATPSFDDYRGGELERLLLEQWSAFKELRGALSTTNSTISAGFSALTTADAERVAADLQVWTDYGNWLYQLGQLGLQGLQVTALIMIGCVWRT